MSVIITARVLLPYVFFQAEDGIRAYKVTGVQTCALPISLLYQRIYGWGRNPGKSGERGYGNKPVPDVFVDVAVIERGGRFDHLVWLALPACARNIAAVPCRFCGEAGLVENVDKRGSRNAQRFGN